MDSGTCLGVHAGDACRSLQETIAIRVLTDCREYLADRRSDTFDVDLRSELGGQWKRFGDVQVAMGVDW